MTKTRLNPSQLRRKLCRFRLSGICLLMLPKLVTAQTFTSPSTTGTFSNPLIWNLGAGPAPVSSSSLALTLQSYGGNTTTLNNDLNLTLNTLNLFNNRSGNLTVAGTLNGGLAFSGAAQINLLGTGAGTITLSAPVVLGSTASGLTFDGGGAAGVTVSGVIASNTSAGAPLTIATDAGNASTGVVTLSGANTFAGGVVLSTGTLSLGSSRALGDRTNVLTVNGGNIRSNAATSVANAVTLNGTLNFNSANQLTLAGALGGTGGVTASGSSTTSGTLVLTGVNSYSGATVVRGQDFAAAALDGAGLLQISGAAGSILSTSGISITEGGRFQLKYDAGNSAANSRVSTGTAITSSGGYLEVIGNAGVVTQSLGTLNAGGLTTVLAGTTGAAGSATQVTIANLARSTGGTVTFAGPNLGGAAVAAGLGAAQGNVILTQIDGGAASAALVGGGGGAGTTNISILPWALGDVANTQFNSGAGTGFVTYDTNGVRLLNTSTEYNTGNNVNTAAATDNMRITAAPTNLSANRTVNSMYFATTGLTQAAAAGTLTITSGALASNVAAATISAPVNFGTGGAGEAVVNVVGALNTTNLMTISGILTAASLTKSGHGQLVLSNASNAISGAITVNGGDISVASVAQLGGATSYTFNGQSDAASRAGFTFTNLAASPQTLTNPVTVNGGSAFFAVNTATATLNLNSDISGDGGVRYEGGGIKIPGGTNTYTGGTHISAGTVQLSSDAKLGNSSGFLQLSGGLLQLTGAWTSARSIGIDGTAILDTQANNASLSGAITGTGALTKIGSGTMTITGAGNGYSGTITMGNPGTQGGTLALSGSGALDSASVQFGLGATSGAGTYVFDISAATDHDATDGSSIPWRSLANLSTATGFTRAHTVQLGATAFTQVDLRVGGGTFGGSAGIIAGFGDLVKVGTGSFALNGATASTFKGLVSVWGGTLSFTADNQLGSAPNPIHISGGILSNGSSVTTSRDITLGATPQPLRTTNTAETLVNGIEVTAGTTTLSGNINGSGGFNKSGAGILALGSTNNFTGDLQITAGTVQFTADNQLGSGNRVRLNGGTLGYNSGAITSLTHPLILTSNSTLSTPALGGRLELEAPIIGSTAMTLTRIGTDGITIEADNSGFFGTLAIGNGGLAAGNVSLANSGSLRRATLTMLTSAASTFDMSGLVKEIGAIGTSTANTFAAGNTVSLGINGHLTVGFTPQTMTWLGNITGNSASSVTKVGMNNLTIQSNGNTFGGGFHILSGANTTLSGNGTLPSQSAFTVGGWGDSKNSGSYLVLDNTTTNLGTRLADTQTIHSNAGNIIFTTNTTTATSETVGSLRGAGQTSVTMTTGGTLDFSNATTGLTRVDGGTFLFRAGNSSMGSGAASTTVANLTFGNLPGSQLIGGGGFAGSFTISILPYAIGGTTTGDAGTSFVTYGANGIRVLNTGTEFDNYVDEATLVAPATENVRFNNSALTTTTLGGSDATINSLAIAGNDTSTRIESVGSERLIVTSGAILNTVNNVFTISDDGITGVPLGIQTAELRTGASNTRELIVSTTTGTAAFGGHLAIGAQITTSGGLTKGGDANLYLTNTANSYTGDTTINAGRLVIDNLAALGGSTQLNMGGGYLTYRGASTTLTGFSVWAAGGSGPGLGASAGFDVTAGATLTLPAGSVSGNGGIIKAGNGVLVLQGTNTNKGATIINGGALAITDPAALGTHSYVLFGNDIDNSGGLTLRFDAPMTLTKDFGTLSSNSSVGIGFDTNGNNVTLSGVIAGTTSRGVYKFGDGNLTLSATQMYTGSTVVFGGALTLSGANGSIASSSAANGFITSGSVVVANNAALVLDNSAANNNNRLYDSWDLPYQQANLAGNGRLVVRAGEFKVIGNASTATSERLNRFDLSTGTITLVNAGQNVSVTSGAFNGVNALPAGLIRGDNLGSTPGNTTTNWFVTDLSGGTGSPIGGVPLNGAGGEAGTPFVNILAGFMGDTSATGSGTDLVTYSADVGFRTLTSGEYTTSITANNFLSSRAANVLVSGTTSVDSNAYINALKLTGGTTLTGTGAPRLVTGTVLATGNATISAPVLASAILSGSNQAGYSFLTSGASTTLTVNSVLSGNQGISFGILKYGEGTLELGGRYQGSGLINIGQGTLRLTGSGIMLNGRSGSTETAITIAPGATLDLGGQDRTIGELTASSSFGFYNGGGQARDGTVNLGANRLTIYGDSGTTFGGDITGAGGVTKAYFSTGDTVFTAPLSYTGSTIIRNGNFSLAAGGTLASSAVQVIGGQLEFDNSDDQQFATGIVQNRVGLGTPITLVGGSLHFRENERTPGNHALGTVALEGGAEFVVTLGTPGESAGSTITIANLTRSAGRGTLRTDMDPLGLVQSPVGGVRIFTTQINGGTPAAALIGGGGAVGTTTQSILPWATDGVTESFFTYGANGLRPLATSEYEENLLDGPSSATVNARITNHVTLTAARTVNALAVVGAQVSGAFDLTLTSGALAISNQTVGVNTNALLTGAGNTRELVINSNGLAETLNYNLTTSGGVTKFGFGELTLGGTNSFTGGLQINQGSIMFTSDANVGASGGVVRFAGGDGTANLFYTGATTAPLEFNRPIETTGFGSLLGQNNHIWRVNGIISGQGGIEYDGAGSQVFEINAANTYTGPTLWDSGHLYISADSAFGNGGELNLAASSANSAIVARANWSTSRLIDVQSSSAIQTNGNDVTWSGPLLGSAALAKYGNGSLIITDSVSYSGSITSSAGNFVLRNQGSLAANTSTHIFNGGATFTLDDSGTHHPDRINDIGSAITLNGATLSLLGNGGLTTDEVINVFAIGANAASTVSVTPGGGQAAILRIGGTLTVSVASTSLWRGTNLGVNAPGTANSATIILTEANAAQQGGVAGAAFLTGGGAAAGNPSVSIIRGAFGDTSATGLGTQLVTYDFDKGVRLLNPTTEYTTTLVSGSIVSDNVKVDGSALSLANATTANALWLKDGGSFGGAGTLTLSSGTILVSGTGNTVSGTISAGVNAFAIGGAGDVTFSNAITSANTGGLHKLGAGTLTLSTANAYTGATIFDAGTIAVGDAGAFGAGGLQFQGGAIQNVSGGALTIGNSISLNDTMFVTGAQDINFSGSFLLNRATREVNVTNTGVTTISGIVSNSQSLINFGLTKSGAGLLVLSNGGNTYDGPTIVSGGTLRVDANGALGTVWSGTTVQNGATLHLNGVNYSNAETLALNGTGISGGGALRNIGTSTYAGQITAETNASIHAGGGTLNLTGGLVKNGTTLTLTGGGLINISGTGISGTLGNSDLVVDATTVVVSAASNYNGPTTVQNSGVLVANAEIDTTTVTVTSNSTLSGTGRVDSATNNYIYINGALVVGDSTLGSPVASQLEIATSGTGSTVLGVSGSVRFDLFAGAGLGDNTGTASSADRLRLFGLFTSTLGGALVLGNPSSMSGFADGDQWLLFDLSGGGAITGSFALDYSSLGPLGPGLFGVFNSSTGIFSITSAVPEPGRAMLLVAGLSAALLRRRTRVE